LRRAAELNSKSAGGLLDFAATVSRLPRSKSPPALQEPCREPSRAVCLVTSVIAASVMAASVMAASVMAASVMAASVSLAVRGSGALGSCPLSDFTALLAASAYAKLPVPQPGATPRKKPPTRWGQVAWCFDDWRSQARAFALSGPLAAGKGTHSGDNAEDGTQRSGFGNRGQLVLGLATAQGLEIHDANSKQI